MGRLAQLVERHIDVMDVTGSNPVSPTRLIFRFCYSLKHAHFGDRNQL